MDRIQKLERNLEAVRYIGTVLSKSLKIDELLTLIIDEMTKLMSAERGSLFIVDRKHNELWSKIAQKSEMKEIRVKIGMGVSGWVAQYGKMLNIPDAAKDDRFDSSTDRKTGYQTKSLLTAPIFKPSVQGGNQVIAVVQVLNKKSGEPFDSDDETLIQLLASQISISLTNAFLYTRLEQKVSELNYLLEIEKKVNQSIEYEQSLQDIVETIVDKLGAEAGSIVLLDDDKESLYFKVATGEHQDYLKKKRIKSGTGIVGWVTENLESALVNEPKSDERFYHKIAEEINMIPDSLLCVPLISEGKPVGAIEMINKRQSKYFTRLDQEVLELISGQITRIIETLQLRDKAIEADRLSSIGNMASMIVHDLRAPMGNIHGFVDLMADDETNPEEREEYGEIVINQIKNLISMTNEILDFAKGKTTILPRKVSTRDVYHNYVKLVENDLKARNIDFQHSNNADDAIIYADLNKLIRVFLNVQKNANESNDRPDKQLLFSIDRFGTEICFTIQDNGPGIPDEIRESLFDSFVTSGKEQGTGLGLAIVKRIIDDHKGRIEVDSGSSGTTFLLFLNEYIDD